MLERTRWKYHLLSKPLEMFSLNISISEGWNTGSKT